MSERCEHYESLNGHECDWYKEELYTVGISRYCKLYKKELYNLPNACCPHRPIYSDEYHGLATSTKVNIE